MFFKITVEKIRKWEEMKKADKLINALLNCNNDESGDNRDSAYYIVDIYCLVL